MSCFAYALKRACHMASNRLDERAADLGPYQELVSRGFLEICRDQNGYIRYALTEKSTQAGHVREFVAVTAKFVRAARRQRLMSDQKLPAT